MHLLKPLSLFFSLVLPAISVSPLALSQTSATKGHADYTQFTHVFKSNILNEERTVVVQLPKSYQAEPDKTYPVIYRLDGAGNVPLITSVIERLQHDNAAPEVIIVAIENTKRLRDLYPTVNEEPGGPVGFGGGGKQFLDFFEQELIPLIAQKYRTHDYKVIGGASAAGVFALYAMTEKPTLFQAHLAYSPAVWWNYGAAVTRTKDFLKNNKTLDTYLYMNIGEEAGFIRERYDDLQQFIQKNKPFKFSYVSDALNGVSHNLTSAAGAFNAYHNLFMAKQMPLKKLTYDMTSIDAYYKKLSAQWGEQIAPPERAVRELGYQLIGIRNYDKAVQVFAHNTKLHPNSVDAWWGLSYGYEQKKDNKKALETLEKAIRLADTSYPYLERMTNDKERLKNTQL